jgi:segregation and condensation protein B
VTDTTPVDTDTDTDTDTAPDTSAPESSALGEVLVPEDQVSEAIEALLMVADQPVSVVGLAQATGTPTKVVSEVLSDLQKTYDGETGGPRRGFELREVGGGWRLYARRDWDDLIRSFIHDDSPQRLSQAALETLAVVAYKQPVTRPQVSAVRAVNVDSVMRTLLARGLITEDSTDPETGAIFYATTPLLLEYLGIESLEDLPPLSPLLEDGASGFDGVEH